MSSPINHYDTNTDGSYLIDDGGQNYGSTVEREMKSIFFFGGGGRWGEVYGDGFAWLWPCMTRNCMWWWLHDLAEGRRHRKEVEKT